MMDSPSPSPWRYVHQIDVDGYFVYLAISETGDIKIGSKKQIKNARASSFFISEKYSCWITLLNPNYSHTLLHTKIIDKNIWCNLGSDLEPSDKEYPFLFMTWIRWMSIQKMARDIKDKHDDHLRQQRLLHGI